MKKLMLLASCAMLLAFPAAGQAQLAFGPQLSWGSDADFGIGGRVVFGLQQLVPNLEGIISGDYFFIDCPEGLDCSWIELNANAALPLTISGSSLNPYVGGGLNVARVSVDVDGFGGGSDTEIGLNILGGLKFPMASMTPFAEARFTLAGGEQFVISGGILFGGRR